MAEPIILEGVLTGFDQEPLGGVRVVADPRRSVVVHDGGVAVKTTRTVTAKEDDEDPTGSLNMPLVWAQGLSYRVYAEPDGILRELGVLDCDAHAAGSVVNVKALPPATAPVDEAADAAWRAWVRAQLALLDPAALQQFIDDYLTDNPPSGGVTDHADLDGRAAADQHPIDAITNLQATLGSFAADIESRQTAAQVDARVQQVVGAAPEALDTLAEIADRLADDADTVAALTAQVAGKVPSTRTVNGKPLSADVTLDAGDVGAATTTQGAKADSAVQPAALDAYVPASRTVNSKALSANITLDASDVGAATPSQVSSGDSATLAAAQSHAQGLVDALTAASPATLDTLAEIAAALGEDPNFAATMTSALANRVRFDAAQSLTVPQQDQARTNIGAAPARGADDNYVTDAEKAKLANLSGTNTGDQDLSGYATTASLATVATTGAYSDLTGTPTIPDSPDDIGAAPATQTINAQTGTTYTLVAGDAGKVVTLTNAGAITLTVPSGTFSAGQRVDIAQRGAGAVTVVGSGVTVNAPPGGSLVTEGQYAYASIFFISSTVADVVGLMAAP